VVIPIVLTERRNIRFLSRMNKFFSWFFLVLVAMSIKTASSSLVPLGQLAQNLFQARDEGWVCKLDPLTGTCGDMSMEGSPESIRALAIRFFGVKHGRCRSHGYCKFVRKEDVDCGVLGTRTCSIYRSRPVANASPSHMYGVYRTLVNRSLQRVIHGSDSHPGRTFII